MKWLVIVVCFSAVSNAAEEGNWFTKSLDNFSPAKCSPLDKTNMVGGFYTCLNGAGMASTSSGSQPQQKPQKKQNSWGSWGTSSYNSGNSANFKDYKSKFANDKAGSPDKKASDSEWPLSMVK